MVEVQEPLPTALGSRAGRLSSEEQPRGTGLPRSSWSAPHGPQLESPAHGPSLIRDPDPLFPVLGSFL